MDRVSIGGVEIITSQWLTETVTTPVRRSWRERLWSWPWRPWVVMKLHTELRPSRSFYKFGNKLACHPQMLPALRAQLGATPTGAHDHE